MIPRPTSTKRNEDKDTTAMWFEDGSAMTCYVRGGIAWPMTFDPDSREVYGYAVLVGQDIKTNVKWVFEERRFLCIDHVIREQKIIHQGLAPWMARTWSHYFCHTWFYHQPEIMHEKYRRMIWDSKNIDPKPMFTEVHWDHHNIGELAIWEEGGQGRLRMSEGTDLQAAIDSHQVQRPEEPAAEIWALMCALNGLQQHPWYDPSIKLPEPTIEPRPLTRRERWGHGKL